MQQRGNAPVPVAPGFCGSSIIQAWPITNSVLNLSLLNIVNVEAKVVGFQSWFGLSNIQFPSGTHSDTSLEQGGPYHPGNFIELGVLV